MSAQVTTSPLPTQILQPDVIRRTANFKPSIWGDRFLTITSDYEIVHVGIEKRIESLKEEVRRELIATTHNSSKQLSLIDAIQRLGVAYHFEREIEEILEHIYSTHDYIDDDINGVSLLFRLLRQQGFNITCDIFNKFVDEKGNFSESLSADVEGMLGLYEAAHLRKHEEDILDEALAFTTVNLKSAVAHLSNPLLAKVCNALEQPLHKGLRRLEAKRYICTYQEEASHNETLLNLAKLDFNLVQSLHKKELRNISRWWKELDFSTKLPFARDRVVELYFWIVGVYSEPKYSLARKILTKVISLTSIIDDIYDVYGTLEEIQLFTDAIERWDINSMDQLPEYMKLCYQVLLDVFKEIEDEMVKEERLYKVHYAREAMKNQVRAYFEEAKWFHKKYTPTMEEYMPLALVTTGYSMLTTVSFVGMGDIATKEAFEWVCTNPKIIKGSEIICRLMDDMTSHKFEQKRGHCASAIECYMEQYGASEKQAHEDFNKQLVNAWKDINEECLQPTVIPMPLLSCVLNLSRAIDVIYKEEDGYTNVGEKMRNNIASLLIDPVPI